jgi:2-phospho-L-lactate guanylyltransferase (CobY/MobA/RfbA family)
MQTQPVSCDVRTECPVTYVSNLHVRFRYCSYFKHIQRNRRDNLSATRLSVFNNEPTAPCA